jgi:hypothetical protein
MQVMSDINPSAPTPASPESPRRRRRRWPIAAVVAIAATIAIVVGVFTLSGGSGPLAPSPAAAAELHHLADLAGATSAPLEPYAVQARVTSGATGSAGTNPTQPGSSDLTTYGLGQGNYVTESAACSSGVASPLSPCGANLPGLSDDADLAHATTVAEVDALVEERVNGYTSARPELSRAAATLQIVARGLHSPVVSPVARGELLRMVADTGSISVEHDMRTQLGATGSRFSAETPTGSFDVVVDPSDGYVLETSSVDSQQTIGSNQTTSYGRPAPAGALPERIAQARDALIANTPAMESANKPIPGQDTLYCDVSTRTLADHVTPVPAGLSLVHCFTVPG